MRPEKPDIVIILSDQHSPYLVGYGGDPLVNTPAIDALAEGGVTFTNAYCPSPVCSPSRMALLAGRHTSDIDVLTNNCALPTSTPTFLHSLGAAGYETVLCGRMHFNGPDQRHGFEKRIFPEVAPSFTPLPRQVTGLGMTRDAFTWSGPGNTVYIDYDREVTEEAVRFLRERGPSERPLCLVVGYVLPHCPFVAPPEYYDRVYPHVRPPELGPGELESEHPVLAEERRRYFEGIEPEEARRSIAAYYGLVEELDRNVGRVLDAVGDAGMQDDALVIYTSDHGELIGEHGMWWKFSMYEASVKVPMVWSWPGRFRSGARVDRVVSLLDLPPTLLSITGAAPLPNAVGRSLEHLLGAGEDEAWEDVAYSELAHEYHSPRRMVRSGDWKLVIYAESPQVQLFNLAEDPQEVNDLGADPRYADIRERLKAMALDGWDPDQIRERLRRRLADIELIKAWESSQYPHRPAGWKALVTERWKPPQGTNWIRGLTPEPETA